MDIISNDKFINMLRCSLIEYVTPTGVMSKSLYRSLWNVLKQEEIASC
ncbi:hypothetical protein OCHUTO_0675 [Orientia chuto str. Dubai]|uniref:Uncharacterized protein n=1 Tax=Orientia chuto str. Dubai TaxID=1359168 RepID=A0A0F3MJC4_9RICK|nr:hypothetical protein OCHUTO_0675 [Orientia chuto str. Dubai]